MSFVPHLGGWRPLAERNDVWKWPPPLILRIGPYIVSWTLENKVQTFVRQSRPGQPYAKRRRTALRGVGVEKIAARE